MHLSPSISTRKTPMHTAAPAIALDHQGHNVLPQMIEALDAFGQTASLKNADLNLGHIEPTPMLGRVMHLQSRPNGLRFLRRKGLIQTRRGMRVEIVHHQADHARLGRDLIHQQADRLSEIDLGALLSQFNRTATDPGFHEHKQVRRSQALVLRVGPQGWVSISLPLRCR